LGHQPIRHFLEPLRADVFYHPFDLRQIAYQSEIDLYRREGLTAGHGDVTAMEVPEGTNRKTGLWGQDIDGITEYLTDWRNASLRMTERGEGRLFAVSIR